MKLAELLEILQEYENDGVDMTLEIRDDENPEYTIDGFDAEDEPGKIYIQFVEVEE